MKDLLVLRVLFFTSAPGIQTDDFPFSCHKECNSIYKIKWSILCVMIEKHQELSLWQSWSTVYWLYRPELCLSSIRVHSENSRGASRWSEIILCIFIQKHQHRRKSQCQLLSSEHPLTIPVHCRYSVSIVSHIRSRKIVFWWFFDF